MITHIWWRAKSAQSLSSGSDAISLFLFGVTCPSQSVWLPSLTPDKNNEIASDPELEDCTDSARHQMCVIIAQNGEHNEQAEESEAFDSQGNPYVDPADLTRGTGNKYPAVEGGPPREKIKISQAAWDRVK